MKAESRESLWIQEAVAVWVGVPLVWISATVLWQRPPAWMGLSFAGMALLAGIALGMSLPMLVVALLKMAGQASIVRAKRPLTRAERARTLASIAGMAAFTGLAEEVVFRAMVAREWSLAWGWPAAILLSGAYFGTVHLIGQAKTLTASKAATMLIASLAVSFMFAAMYIRGGSVWPPVGFHAAWSFSLVGILGLPMSGKRIEGGLLRTTLAGKALWTGGECGIEMGAGSVAAYLVIGLLFCLG